MEIFLLTFNKPEPNKCIRFLLFYRRRPTGRHILIFLARHALISFLLHSQSKHTPAINSIVPVYWRSEQLTGCRTATAGRLPFLMAACGLLGAR
jgi:hypothetical protein